MNSNIPLHRESKDMHSSHAHTFTHPHLHTPTPTTHTFSHTPNSRPSGRQSFWRILPHARAPRVEMPSRCSARCAAKQVRPQRPRQVRARNAARRNLHATRLYAVPQRRAMHAQVNDDVRVLDSRQQRLPASHTTKANLMISLPNPT